MQFERMCGAAAAVHHGHPPQVEMELLALSHCVARRVKRSDDGIPASETVGFGDDIAAFMKGATRSWQVLQRSF